jgi:hypothetical protein
LQTRYPANYFLYLDLGSFLTDISQFNDPFNMMSKKWLLQAEKPADEFMDELLGSPGAPGAMAEYFRLIAKAVARLVFCDLSEFIEALGKRLAIAAVRNPAGALAAAARAGDALWNNVQKMTQPEAGRTQRSKPDLRSIADYLQDRKVPHADFEVIFAKHYTQYYPHEHMDMPPWDPPPASDHFDFMPYPSKLISYLEDYKNYLLESFSALEDRFLIQKDYSSLEGRLLLVQTGHLLHAVEDFFFHSNFAELQQRNLGDKPLKSVADERKRLRRLRYPEFDPATEADKDWVKGRTLDFHPSTFRSSDQGELLYTGFFGGEDSGHSIADALHGLSGFMTKLLGPMSPSASEDLPVLLRLIVDQGFRATAAAEGDAPTLKRHRMDMIWPRGDFEGSVWDKKLASWRSQGLLSEASWKDLRDAFSIDVALIQKHGVINIFDEIGIGAALISLLLDGEREEQRSQKRADELDLGAIGADQPTYNGASAETIGTHSLLSKDSVRKSPFREETFAVAAEASLRFAERLISRQGIGEDNGRRVDWLALLDEYLRFPHDDAKAWENLAVGKLRNTQEISTPRTTLPTVWTKKDASSRLRGRGSTKRLEGLYHALEAPAERGSLPRWLTPPAAAPEEAIPTAERSFPAVNPISVPAIGRLARPM